MPCTCLLSLVVQLWHAPGMLYVNRLGMGHACCIVYVNKLDLCMPDRGSLSQTVVKGLVVLYGSDLSLPYWLYLQ